ncbi:MAG: ATP-binding cassette domain-containing protein [Burkholderiaceae bacterium]
MSTVNDGAAIALRATAISKRFGDFQAVDGLDLAIRQGECFGLLGPNGAGKSTTLKLLLGLLTPDAGRIELLGLPVPAQARRARSLVGVVPQNDALDPDFTVAENLIVFGRYFGMSRREGEAKVPELLDFAGLAAKADASIQSLSGGMRRRLTIARALINDPRLLFLDEPTTGLDPQARHMIWERLKQLTARGKTILLTTHFMDEAERLCDRLAVIDHGRKIAEDSPQGLVRSRIEPSVVEVYGDGLDAFCARLQGMPAVQRIERVGETAFVYNEDPAPIMAAAAEAPGLRTLQRAANLEDVFLKLTGRDLRD